MADHPDHQERPMPFENIIGSLPANVAAYRSTAVQVDNSGGGATTVTVTWHMNDAPALSTSEAKAVNAGQVATLFFVNQGDVLESVTGGGGATIHAVSESNQLPLPPSGAAPGGGTGVFFDTTPQPGTFLDIETTKVGATWADQAINLEARWAAIRETCRGFYLQAGVGIPGGASHLTMDDAGNAQLDAQNELALIVSTGQIRLFGIPAADPAIPGALFTVGAPAAGVPKQVWISGG